MRIFFPYNEILPKRAAHDFFLMQECAAFGEEGHEAILLCGKGSFNLKALCHHYRVAPSFAVKQLLIVRKNNPLKLSWNLPFFALTQRTLKKEKAGVVVLSVLKQAAYLAERKLTHLRYIYEAHELKWYPNQPLKQEFYLEKRMLSQMDHVVTTTTALEKILREPPYSLSVPITTIPLAVSTSPLPPAPKKKVLGYVGQLYQGQGIELLLQALQALPEWQLKVIGGKEEELRFYVNYAKQLGVLPQVHFYGFLPPQSFQHHLHDVAAFVAPFLDIGRMPYVAHTKLYEYAKMGRPFVAPDLMGVRDHFPKGVAYFQPNSAQSLAETLSQLDCEGLEGEMGYYDDKFTFANRIQSLISITV